jgi:8-amino-7-oxononanoate synthase
MNYSKELKNLKNIGLYRDFNTIESPQERVVKIQNKNYLNFSSNNYLNLANNKEIKNALIKGIKKYGAGAGASRFISGNLEPYNLLENSIAKLKGEEACIVFNTGYMANLGILSALADKDDVIFTDRINHASIIDAIKLCGAKMVVYKHCDIKDLNKKLQKYKADKRIIITDSVFSMDGDIAPLTEINKLAKKYKAMLIVDEAHSFGVFGKNGAGLTEQLNLQGEIDIVMGTLSKAAGLFGGYICGKQDLIDYIRNKARSLIYTTALPPCIVYAGITALDIIKKEKQTRDTLWNNINYFKEKTELKIDSQIIPILVGDNKKVLKISKTLKENLIYLPAIRFPTVKKGTERLRISLMASHTKKDIDLLIKVLKFH